MKLESMPPALTAFIMDCIDELAKLKAKDEDGLPVEDGLAAERSVIIQYYVRSDKNWNTPPNLLGNVELSKLASRSFTGRGTRDSTSLLSALLSALRLRAWPIEK